MPLLCDTMIPYHHYTYGAAATQTAVLLYTERFFYFFTIQEISVIVYWLSLTVRVLLAMYWHFRDGRYYYY